MEWHQSQWVPYPKDFLFNMVKDVERYPDYIPGCKAIKILQEGDLMMEVELLSWYGISFCSTVTWREESHIFIDGLPLVQGAWCFETHQQGTLVKFSCTSQEGILGAVIAKAGPLVMRAFLKRAKNLYLKRAREGSNS